MRLCFALVYAALLLWCLAEAASPSGIRVSGTTPPPPTGPLNFIHVSDIHFDPTYNPCSQVSDFCRGSNVLEECHPMGQFGCDSPEALVTSMIADMKLTTPNPAFIIVSGDSAAHDMTESDTLASVRFVMASLQAAFPGVPLYPVVGNNDCYPKNSLPIGPSSYLSSLSSMLSSSSLLPPSVWASFQKGGYYAHSPVPGLLIVSINSVYWYKKWISFDTQASLRQAQPFLDTLDSDSKLGYYVVEDLEAAGINTSTIGSDPAGQFAWLEQILKGAQAANQMCILTWHVGIGTSATGGDILWNSDFYDSFVSIMKNYHDNVIVMLSGHTHRDFFNLLYDSGTASSGKLIGYQLLPGALTPRDLSNPSYRTFTLAANLSSLIDYAQNTWLPAEQAWVRHYLFSEASNGLAPTLSGMETLYQNMVSGKWPADADYTVCTFMNSIWAGGSECVWSASDETLACQDLFCSITETDTKKLSSCTSNKPKTPMCPSSNNCNLAAEYCITI